MFKLPNRGFASNEVEEPPRRSLGLSLGGPNSLALGASAPQLRLGEAAQAQPKVRVIDPLKQGLEEGETLEKIPFEVEGQNSYRSNLYKKLRANKTIKSIRKVANMRKNRRILYETIKEKRIYTDLMTKAGAENYIMPFEGGNSNNSKTYINFKWLDGSDLIQYINTKKPSLKEKVSLLIEAANALKWLIDVGGYSHQDIKFDNIFRRSDGHILLLDFGLAKEVHRLLHSDVRKDVYDFSTMVEGVGIDPSELPELPDKDTPQEELSGFFDSMITFLQTKHDAMEGGKRRNKRKTIKQRKSKK